MIASNPCTERRDAKRSSPLELNKKNVRIILLIIVFTVVLFTAVQNIGAILGFA